MKKRTIGVLFLLVSFLTLSIFGGQVNANGIIKPDSKLGPGYYSANTQERAIKATDPTKFLADIKNGALESWKKYHVLPSITAAQAALESGWGTSELSTKAHNLFGIKGDYNGQYVMMPTKEFINGQWVTIEAKFKKYPSKNESMIDHGDFLQKPRYQNIIGETDYKTVAKNLQADGYATDPEYASKLISIVERWGLVNWDKEAFTKGNLKWIWALDVMSVRELPDWNSKTVFQAYKYKSLQVDWDVKKDGWYQVLLDGKVGWMKPAYFTNKQPFDEYKVRDAVANFRTGADWNTPVAYQLQKNQVVSVSKIEKPKNGFYPSYFRGKQGFMPIQYLVKL
ncbi:glucosaminidase domain-containing protein [Listeria sp. PSOL-1]|uniref:glucosaminidase domain-containing protein n=1 Tax=Listeria sp. PSOL-1 TaxID=1844999 RepID=UPI0013D03EAF|nr:glucosaminidase domain-containing protein [Listeria sp. PSOL-1]